MVFRALHSGEKFLHLYLNEKRFHEAENPKWDVSLQEATSVYFLSDRRSFCCSMSDGGLLFLDSSTTEEAEEWVRCLNAVLFAKGVTGGMRSVLNKNTILPWILLLLVMLKYMYIQQWEKSNKLILLSTIMKLIFNLVHLDNNVATCKQLCIKCTMQVHVIRSL